MKTIPKTKKDLAWTGWTAVKIKKLAQEIITKKKRALEEIKEVPDEARTFHNTVYALEASEYEIEDDINQIAFLMYVSPKKRIRKAAQDAITILQDELTELAFDREIYEALEAYAAKKETLTGEDKKLFEDLRREYRRLGFTLPQKTQNKVKKNLQAIQRLSTEFDKNLAEYHDEIIISKKEAKLLPKSFVAGLPKTKDGYRVSLQYPAYFPFMQMMPDPKKRKALADKALQKGGVANSRILKKVIALRKENAALLGYENHGAYRTETRMAKNPETVFAFIEKLSKKLSPGVKKELKILTRYKQKKTGDKKARLTYFDMSSLASSYWATMYKKEMHDVDGEAVREYFPLTHVVKETLAIYETLLGVRFKKITWPSWHKDVIWYKIIDTKKKDVRGYFGLDLYPRDGKYGHAAVFSINKGRKHVSKNAYHAPLACMVANFPKPSQKRPSLMSHEEVETFFHEFGHIVHSTLTRATYSSQSGTATARDFVEAPSQMLQNWVWDPAIVRRLSSHYKTKAPLPKKVLENLIAAKQFMICFDTMRQLSLALFDITLHTKGASDPNALYAQIVKNLLNVSLPKNQRFPAGFGHLMGYDAGYYGYMWSKVYAEDMFTRFQKEGLLSKRAGNAYRKWILEKGSSQDEYELVKNFLGRKPNEKAFLKSIGL